MARTDTGRNLATFERDVLLVTGRAVRIRPARRSDADGLGAFYEQLSATSTRNRFFAMRRFIPAEELAAATVQDVLKHVTLVAEAGDDLIAVGEYHTPFRVVRRPRFRSQ